MWIHWAPAKAGAHLRTPSPTQDKEGHANDGGNQDRKSQ
jgi:hypothetical protein